MAAPYAQQKTTIDIDGPLVSKPYVNMTIKLMESFGANVVNQNYSRFEISTGNYQAQDFEIEPDASAASYFWAAAAITDGDVVVEGLNKDALQGDVQFCECLKLMGCLVDYRQDGIRVVGQGKLQGIEIDMNAISDTVQTLAAIALFADGPTRIRGVAHNRHKETDRIGDLATELRKLGATVQEFDDGLAITPGPLQAAEIETYDDHRMAMSLSLPGLKVPGIVIKDPQCTSKTYPGFFVDLKGLC
jgi:3-phosphoshikimate 1-carboxyvinyltransferase